MRGPRHRKRTHSAPLKSRWALRLGAIVLLLVVVAAAAVLGIREMPNPAQASEPAVEIQSAHGASFVPALEGKRPLFILALGSDARPGENISRMRADSIHLIGVNPRQRRATILGFPRDSWVSIPGYGVAKINTAMTLGGPPLMVRTIENLTGIRIDFWLLTSFNGLIRMVDGIGGLKLHIPRAMRDEASGSNFSAGRHHLTGEEALAFARDRHSVPGGDFGRSLNHGRLFLAALTKLRSGFDRNPGKLFRWITVGWRNVRTDLGLETLVDLGLTATQVRPSRVNNLLVPAAVGTVGPQSVVFLSPRAPSVYADMRADGVVGR
jgi:LCP family protein required for cell wall assembly